MGTHKEQIETGQAIRVGKHNEKRTILNIEGDLPEIGTLVSGQFLGSSRKKSVSSRVYRLVFQDIIVALTTREYERVDNTKQ